MADDTSTDHREVGHPVNDTGYVPGELLSDRVPQGPGILGAQGIRRETAGDVRHDTPGGVAELTHDAPLARSGRLPPP